MTIKGIILDFDGVILDSVDIKTRAFAELFKDHPAHINEIIRLHIANGGMSRFDKFRIIYREMLQEVLPEAHLNELGRRFSEIVYDEVLKCPFIPGAYEFLNKYYKKHLLFIVSGTPQEEIERIIVDRKLERYFAGVFGSPEDKATLTLNILSKYDMKPAAFVSVGDSINDYEGAVKAGVRFIGKISKQQNPFDGITVDGLVNDLFELEKYLLKAG